MRAEVDEGDGDAVGWGEARWGEEGGTVDDCGCETFLSFYGYSWWPDSVGLFWPRR